MLPLTGPPKTCPAQLELKIAEILWAGAESKAQSRPPLLLWLGELAGAPPLVTPQESNPGQEMDFGQRLAARGAVSLRTTLPGVAQSSCRQ